MDNGKILAQGTLNELLSKYVKGEVISFSLNEKFNENYLPSKENVLNLRVDDESNDVELIVEDLVSYLPGFLNKIQTEGLSLTSLECRKMTLDDLFITMTGKHLNA